jgi:homoserine kinase type II
VSPLVEMLWEPSDPHHALGERFGFGDGESAGRWVAATLDGHWGVHVRSCERIVISDHNALAWVGTSVGRLVAKWSVVPERFPRLAETARLTHWLAGQGLPVSAPVPALDGRVQVEVDGASMGLQRVIGGGLLDTADPAQVRAAGAVLARLQDALAACPDTDRVAALAGPSVPLTTRVTNWLNSGPEHVSVSALGTLRTLVAEAPPDPVPTQLVHHDFRSANVLCAGAEVAAVIDFEEARFDHRVVELARSAVMLGTRFRDWGPVSADVRAGFLAGYQSVRPLTRVEAAWWDALQLWQALAAIPPGADPTGWGREADACVSHIVAAWSRPSKQPSTNGTRA